MRGWLGVRRILYQHVGVSEMSVSRELGVCRIVYLPLRLNRKSIVGRLGMRRGGSEKNKNDKMVGNEEDRVHQ
jgi:hypothetical protein